MKMNFVFRRRPPLLPYADANTPPPPPPEWRERWWTPFLITKWSGSPILSVAFIVLCLDILALGVLYRLTQGDSLEAFAIKIFAAAALSTTWLTIGLWDGSRYYDHRRHDLRVRNPRLSEREISEILAREDGDL